MAAQLISPAVEHLWIFDKYKLVFNFNFNFNFKCNCLTPLHFNGLTLTHALPATDAYRYLE